MTRKLLFALCFALAVGMRLYANVQGLRHDNLLLLPLSAALIAYVLPVALPLAWLDRYAFGYQPFSDEHFWSCFWLMLLAASVLWFFPLDRIARWFGIFDAFGEGKRRLPFPSLSRAAAATLDFLRRLKVGKGKMGGWA